jgi:hypothetical protein
MPYAIEAYSLSILESILSVQHILMMHVLAVSLYSDLICSLISFGTVKLLLKFRQNSLDVTDTKKINLTGTESKKLQMGSSVCLQREKRSGNSANGAEDNFCLLSQLNVISGGSNCIRAIVEYPRAFD